MRPHGVRIYSLGCVMNVKFLNSTNLLVFVLHNTSIRYALKTWQYGWHETLTELANGRTNHLLVNTLHPKVVNCIYCIWIVFSLSFSFSLYLAIHLVGLMAHVLIKKELTVHFMLDLVIQIHTNPKKKSTKKMLAQLW